ncbi:MAG: preprotein translocase subunit YajC [Chlamydiales bacterium]|nr:preprotein translocase subunit YajC [Chlamydiia bacterium]MCP5507840.1 preprotein translocase subunit YajC [Chlamydiales bacterium]
MTRLYYYAAMLMAVVMPSMIFAEDEAVPGREQGLWQTLIMIAIALLFFYVILWRPEQKRRKQMEAQRSAMKQGDRVTAMGIVGTVDQIKEHTVILRMVDGAKIEFISGAITDIHSKED